MPTPILLPRPPTRGEDVLAWARQMQEYVRAITPYSTPRVRAIVRREGASFDVDEAAPASPATTTYPWQQYQSPWLGTGTDPNASDRAKRFRLIRGKCSGRTPTNMMDEFVAFGDIADTGIEESDAVITQVYLSVPVTETDLGSGVISVARGTIEIAEGDDFLDAVGEVPAGGDDGSLSASFYISLCEVSVWGGAMHFPPGRTAYFDLGLVTSGLCGSETRSLFVI